MFERRRLLSRSLAVMAAFSATPALALSCMRFDPVDAFTFANEATESYVVIRGALAYDASEAPEGYSEDNVPVSIPGTVAGKLLGENGFQEEVGVEVMLDIGCTGGWCGGVPAGEDVLMFLRYEDESYHIALDPCQPMAFSEPQAEVIADIEACMDGNCPQ